MLYKNNFDGVIIYAIHFNISVMFPDEQFHLLVQYYISLKKEFKEYKTETINILNQQSVIIENQFAVIKAIQKQVDDMTAFMMPTIPEEPQKKH